MRRVGVLIVILALLTFSTANPLAYIDSCTIVDGPFTPLFSTASDGDESSESVTLFSETISDDILFFPDTLSNDTECTASSGASGDETGSGNIGNTHTQNSQIWSNRTTDGVGWVRLNFTFDGPSGAVIDGWSWGLYAWGQVGDECTNYSIYNWVTHVWDYQGDLFAYGSEAWTNGSTHDSDHWSGNECAIIAESQDLDAGQVGMVYVDCGVVKFDYLTLADSDHFAESFAGVDEWTASGSSTVTTDGDVMTHDAAANENADSDGPSFTSMVGLYVEFRIKANVSVAVAFCGAHADGMAGGWAFQHGLGTITTTWTPKKYYVPSMTGYDAGALESIRFYPSSAAKVYFDCLRIGNSTSMGFSHDGSTVAGVTDAGNAGWTYTYSSDGDKLSIKAETTAVAADWGSVYIAYDTTATAAGLERDYYPFGEVSWACTQYDATGYAPRLYFHLDGYKASWSETYSEGFAANGVTSQTTVYHNMKAYSTVSALSYFEVNFYLPDVGQSATVEIDYVKIFSIANFTYEGSNVATTGVFYVDDSNALVQSGDVVGWMKLRYDINPNMNTATYNVWNATLSSGSQYFRFRHHVSAWEWEDTGETRGDFPSGTLVIWEFYIYGVCTLSAIKFIEDGTAPAVVRSSSTPNDPSDDEGVMLTAVVTDAVEVYKVYFDAIVSPAGFSDVPYYATEQTDNLWTYEFATLPTGPYVFKIVATDGANENALTEYAYIELTVREAAIIINPITFLGAGNDFEDVTMSFECNRDGSYVVREWTQSDGSDAANTWTGTVIDGWNNIAWDKLTTDSEAVYFNFTITSGSLSWVYENQYQVAQNTFYLSTASQVEGLDAVTVAGRISKLGAWQLYDENNEFKDSGSITDLDFTIRFTKWSGYDEQDHDFAIKFTNGSQSCWYNSSFYAFKKPAVAAIPSDDPNVLYAFTVSFWTLIAVVAIGGALLVEIRRKHTK